MKHFQKIIPLLMTTVIITSCGINGSSQNVPQPNENSSVSSMSLSSDKGTHVYTDNKGRVEAKLPSSWVGFSAFDGTPNPIQHLGDAIEYGEPNGMRMLIEIFDSENASKNPNETWYEFFLRLRLDSSTYSILQQEDRSGAQYYLLSIQNNDPAVPRYYSLFERENMIVSFGFYEENPMMQQIIDSVKFMQ